jgi:hypothetical protein
VRVVHEQRRDHACPQCDAAFGASEQSEEACAPGARAASPVYVCLVVFGERLWR